MANTFEIVSEEFGKLLLPLQAGFSSPKEAETLINQLGWSLPPAVTNIGLTAINIKSLVTKLEIVIASTPEEREDYTLMATRCGELLIAATAVTANIISTMQAVSNLGGVTTDYLNKTKIHEQLYLRLLDFLVIEYFKHFHYQAFCVFVLFGIFKLTKESGVPTNYTVDYIKHEIIYNNLVLLFSDPKKLFRDVYGWETQNFKSAELLVNLGMLLESFGALIQVKKMRPKWEELFLNRPVPEALTNPMPQVDIALMKSLQINGMEVGLSLFGLRETAVNGTDGGIGLAPYARGTTAIEFQILPKLFFEIATTLDLQGGIALLIRAGKDVELKVDLLNTTQGTLLLSGKIMLTLSAGSKNGPPLVLIGIPGGTRLQTQQIFISAGAGISGNKDLDLIVETGFRKGKLIITAGEGDGFLKKILPADAIELDFDMVIGYSSKTGIYFKGSAALEIRFPLHIALGPIGIEGLTITIKPENGKIPLALGADITATLGPLAAVVQNMGASATLSFPADKKGNAGPVQVDLGFKLPSAVGLSLDTSAITAGGYLKISPDEYIGALEISIKAIPLAIKAIAIINTRLPGGEPGFSLLVIITAEFSPIQITFGFTLNGVGGLFGYKRGFESDVLRLGLKNKTLDSILFPKNVIANITKIVTDLKSVFPMGNSFLIGPMVKIGWASLVTAEIGIIIQVPEPIVIAILGIVRIELPEPKNVVLKLQISFLAIINFEKKLFSLDASLSESRILVMTLTGDIALRIGWGSPGVFIFSSGGFHPDFREAPAELQHMQRLGIVIIDEKDIKLGAGTYFAVTTNTVQIGAQLRFWAKSGGYTALAEVGFDALIQFNPFFFIISLYLTGRITGPMIDIVIDVRGNLSGPNKWRVWGHAHAKVMFFEITIPFDKTFGDPVQELAAELEDVFLLFKEEVTKNANWRISSVSNGTSKVSLRELATNPNQMILHPNSVLSFNQRLVPLDVSIQKFGNKTVDPNQNKFAIQSLNIMSGTTIQSTATLGNNLQDSFAPGHFFEIPKDQKLSRPSFEKLKSGLEFTIGTSPTTSGSALSKIIDYEVIYVRKKKTVKEGAISLLTASQLVQLAGGGSAAKSKLSAENNRTSYQAPPQVGITPKKYVIANKTDLQNVDKSAKPKEYDSQVEAYAMQSTMDENTSIIISNFES